MRQFLTGARLFTGETILEGRGALIDGSRIVSLLPESEAPSGATIVPLPKGSLLAPGFIDVQVNGAGGVQFNHTPTEESARAIARAVRQFGVTGIMPTFITDSVEKMHTAADAASMAARRFDSGVLGIHLEGPFISPERSGCHDKSAIRIPTDDDVKFLCGLPTRFPQGKVLLTLAPEQIEEATMERLAAAGILISGGHTAATYERARDAVNHGLRGFTHLTNAMPPISNRNPGPVVAALDSGDAYVGIICDGFHVHPALLRTFLKAKERGRVFLITDAMAPLGTDAETFILQGQEVFRRGGRLVTKDNVLAGADLNMAQAVRNTIEMLGVPLEEALRMASKYPAAFLHMEDHLGRIIPGYTADLVLLSETLDVLDTWIGGDRSSEMKN